MRIGIVASHAWPIPNAARTGDVYVLDLAKGLQALGHDVTLFAPDGTAFDNLRKTGCAWGKQAPHWHERETLRVYRDELEALDVIHDHSTSKVVSQQIEKPAICQTLTGGPWRDFEPPENLCVFSQAQRERVLRGATDYEGSPTPDLGGPPGVPVKDAHVVYAGVDTDFYTPGDAPKKDFALWLNRWHPVKGYVQAIRIAQETGIPLVMAGVHPDDTTNEHERACAKEAHAMARGVKNVDFRWLPANGHDEAKRALYRLARCLLYPVQFQEPFGLSMVEAMACGTPVVGSRMGSVPEITPWTFNLDADASLNARNRYDIHAAPSVETTRQIAVDNFSRTAMARRYLAEYERILAGETW